ncbi:MAG TPA: hypothetical protein VF605_11745 [Allosphingosinicella sp.]|jgi:hypothetical protein
MDGKPHIRIFKPGRHTAVDGTTLEFTRAHLEASAAAYDAATDPAPLVVGHPKLDAPAWGWVGSLAVEGDELIAYPERVAPEFADAVRDGRYSKVSASFYPPDHPHNPKPGIFSLKHVGFLGAAAPAVKGLGLVHFAEEDERGLVTIETETETAVTKEKDTTDFAEQQADLARRLQDAADREAAADERERTANATIRQALHTSNVAFAETLVATGRLAPAGRDLFVGVMDNLEATATVSFGEGNGEMAPVAAFKKLFEGSAPLIQFGEAAAPSDDQDQGGANSFAAPPGFTADPAALALLSKAHELQAAEPGLSLVEAVKRVGG